MFAGGREKALRFGIASTVCLVIGWFTVLFEVQPFVGGSEKPGMEGAIEDLFAQLIQWASGGATEISLVTGICGVWEEGHIGLAVLLAFFSVIFPASKLAIAIYAVYTTGRLVPEREYWLKILGPWSLLDVAVVALLVMAAKGLPMGTLIVPSIGFYAFGLSIVFAWACTVFAEQSVTADAPK